MPSFKIELPQVGESVTEAVIGKWLKQPGDRVEKYEPLAEVVTDKVSMEFPAPYDGTLTSIIADEGETVPMGSVIAEMDVEGIEGAEVSDEPEAPESGRDEEPASRIGTLVQGANVGPTGGVFRDASMSSQRSSGAAPPQAAGSAHSVGPSRGQGGRWYSPVVMRLARQHGVDLESIQGTGRNGRVTKKDVQSVIEGRRPEEPAVPRTGPAPEPEPVPQPTEGAPASGEALSAAPGEDRIVTPSPVRRMIAEHMTRSVREIPHAWSVVEADVTGMLACRAAHREWFRRENGVDLTMLAFTSWSVAQALWENPMVNASWETQDGAPRIRVMGNINLGLAVAAPDGLVVPVLRDAGHETITGLAVRIGPLIERARTGKLTLEDVQGGTFTLNNTGALGSVIGGAIINHPQAAIVTTEAVVKRPVVVSGLQGDEIAIRSMMNLCVSFDHRVLDGSEAAKFMQDLKRRLESFTEDSELP